MPDLVPASADHPVRPILWTFGEGPTFPGYTDDTHWNGFLNVSVSMATWPYVLRTLIAGADGDTETIAAYREMAGSREKGFRQGGRGEGKGTLTS